MTSFKIWLESNQIINIPVSKLFGWNEKLKIAIEEVKSNKLSYSVGQPIIVSRLDDPRGAFFMIDGYHRAIQVIMAGDKVIQAQIDLHTPRIERTVGHQKIVSQKVNIVQALSQEV